MFKNILLKFQCRFYVFILGLLNLFAFSVIIGCSNKIEKKDNSADSIARIKKINNSIVKQEKRDDSIQEIKRVQDSIAREDSIKKATYIKKKYKPTNCLPEYGVGPTI